MKQMQDHTTWIMVASHNKETVQRAIQLMKEHRLSADDEKVVFGQQLGMGDHLTYPLAHAGYHASKVVAYGSLDDVVPFLARRGIENRKTMKNAGLERKIYTQELRRRFSYTRIWGKQSDRHS